MAIDVVLLGHSFIRRLRDYMNNNHVNHNLRFHPARFMISCCAQGGLTIKRFFLHTSPINYLFKLVVMTYRPHRATLQPMKCIHLPVSFIMAYKFQSLLLVNYCGGIHRQPTRTIMTKSTKSMQNCCN